jgi:unsaturated chondroitin disaccharide hydrolase
MAIKIDSQVKPQDLVPMLVQLFEISEVKIRALAQRWKPAQGSPVFTIQGRYASRGWTEWTQGFYLGAALLQFDAAGDRQHLEWARRAVWQHMATHVSHTGVHDHGFNNISTYGQLRRLMLQGKIAANDSELAGYELALKVSGAIQAARWTTTAEGGGFVYSFNGPHSLFIDTMRSLRSLAVAHQLGHVLMSERDQPVSLLQRLIQHAATTARYAVYYGTGRDAYDLRGRTAHESIFNVNDGHYRCPNSQQGYSAFSTWTRGLAWALLGFAEQLEFMRAVPPEQCAPYGDRRQIITCWLQAAQAVADFYLHQTPVCGVPYWDTGAPNLHRLDDYLDRPADPFNPWEPVDSSAAAIAAQGLIRLGNYLTANRQRTLGRRYRQAGLTVTRSLLQEPYLSLDRRHEGLLLHSVYHRPNGWDYIPRGRHIPCGESSMWGDYHLRELALMLWREARGECYLTFFDCP